MPVAPALIPAAFHLLNAGLLYGVAAGLGLPRRAAVYASLIYLTAFAHFHAVFGLQAIRPLQTLTLFLLLILCLRGLPRLPLLWACVLFSAAAILKGGIAVGAPFVAMVSSFLQPIEAALHMDPAQANYPIPPQIGVWSLLVSVGLAARLVASWRAGNRAPPLLLAWYLFCVVYFLKGAAGSLQVLPSLAFIFLSPIFAIVFSDTLVSLSEKIQAATGASRRTGRTALAGLLLFLCLANLLAIPVGLFRGKLTHDPAAVRGPAAGPAIAFDKLYEQGLSELHQGREPEALELFLQAAAVKPSHLRALLGPCRFSDLRWMTAPLDLRGQLRRIREIEEGNPISLPVIQQEISDYALCLFSISCLEWRAGRRESSSIWLSQIRYLERDPDRLAGWIEQQPLVQQEPLLKEFAARCREPDRLRDPLPWRMDDYGFGLFLVRLLTGRDIRSAWDKQTGMRI